MSLIDLCERGLVPDALTRLGIRRLCAQRLREEGADDLAQADARFRELLDEL
ncbi:MAG: SAM-dependent methyltransferase, partial [Arenimonas sp.]|nr:SAM-dependent methyltransferase [Arenimonas sp.]